MFREEKIDPLIPGITVKFVSKSDIHGFSLSDRKYLPLHDIFDQQGVLNAASIKNDAKKSECAMVRILIIVNMILIPCTPAHTFGYIIHNPSI